MEVKIELKNETDNQREYKSQNKVGGQITHVFNVIKTSLSPYSFVIADQILLYYLISYSFLSVHIKFFGQIIM